MLDRPAKKFDREWLDEATHRTLAHWSLILHLDPGLWQPGDDFEAWAKRGGVDVRRMEEGGAVVRGTEGGAFYFLTADQVEALDADLVEASRENGDA